MKSNENNKNVNFGWSLIIMLIAVLLFFFVFVDDKQEKRAVSNYSNGAQNSSGMSDAYWWYSNNITNIDDSLHSLLSQQGIQNKPFINTQLKFERGLGIYYISNFHGGILNGQKVSGHARAFVKYKDTKIQWFSLEISYDSNKIYPIVDWYKDEYDSIIEDYYYELKREVD